MAMAVESLHRRVRSQSPIQSRAASSASSYHTVLDHFTTLSNAGDESVESVASTARPTSQLRDSTSSPPTTPDAEYEVIQHRRQGKALIIKHPTLVDFVPTSEIQTAVSVTADRIVIDTILPPTAVLRECDRVNRRHAYVMGPSGGNSGGEGRGFDTKEILKKHEAELKKTLADKLTSNYDPTGTIKDEILKTLCGVTRFPDPVGMKGSEYRKDQCPCICCRMACENPMVPYSMQTTAEEHQVGSSPSKESSVPMYPTARSATTILASQPGRASTDQSSSIQPSHSFLDMTDAKPRNKRRFSSLRASKTGRKFLFGFLTLGRHSRSRSQLSPSEGFRGPSSHQPTAAPALPIQVTEQATVRRMSPPQSRSISDLVRRRRSKHMARTAEATQLSTSTTTPNLHTGFQTDTLPRRSSLQIDSIRSPNPVPTLAGRFSLDSTQDRPALVTPETPPRRSSKMYAIFRSQPGPSRGVAGDRMEGTVPKSFTSTYLIGQIVEEEELPDAIARAQGEVGWDGGEDVSRRQSALMSSYLPPAEQAGGWKARRQNSDNEWSAGYGRLQRGGEEVSPEAVEQPHFQTGIAL